MAGRGGINSTRSETVSMTWFRQCVSSTKNDPRDKSLIEVVEQYVHVDALEQESEHEIESELELESVEIELELVEPEL